MKISIKVISLFLMVIFLMPVLNAFNPDNMVNAGEEVYFTIITDDVPGVLAESWISLTNNAGRVTVSNTDDIGPKDDITSKTKTGGDPKRINPYPKVFTLLGIPTNPKFDPLETKTKKIFEPIPLEIPTVHNSDVIKFDGTTWGINKYDKGQRCPGIYRYP